MKQANTAATIVHTGRLAELAVEIHALEEAAQGTAAVAIEQKAEIGRRLIEAKELLPHGAFLPWAKREFGWGHSNVQRHMALAANYPRVGNLAALSLRAALKIFAEPKPKAGSEADDEDTCTATELEALSGREFGTVYADPPWLYGNQGTRAATGNHYGGMPLEEICELPIADIVSPDAHLHLWTTNAFLFDAKRVIEAWGFEYKSCFIWVKPTMGIGNYWRVSHEFLLFGVRGNAPFRNRSLMSWGQFDRTKHSRKPQEVRRFIESASPGPYLELFGRDVATGWTVWGNEIARSMFDVDVPEVVLA